MKRVPIEDEKGRPVRYATEREALALVARGDHLQLNVAGAPLRIRRRPVAPHRWSSDSMGFGMNGGAVNWGALQAR